MPKPFSLQAPEDIAKEYGGNKQKIAQAMQMGLVDPTAGTLAGMFIDRIRSAQMQEGAQHPTVAQQVFSPSTPPAPPAPPAPPMGAPPMGGMPPAPTMGAPPMDGMPPAPPMGAPPMGMADGGVAGLSIPDGMFDEPTDGEFAGGGIVAFNPGGLTSAPMSAFETEDEEQIVSSKAPSGPNELYGFYRDPEAERAKLERMYKPDRTASTALMDYFGNTLSPEGQKKRKDEDKWFALAQLGATMAGTRGSILEAAGAGMRAALPGLRESAKERRAEQRDAIMARAQQEGLNNKESLDFTKLILEGTNKFGQFDVNRLDRNQKAELEIYSQQMANQRTQMQVAGGIAEAGVRGRQYETYARTQEALLRKQAALQGAAELAKVEGNLSTDVGKAKNAAAMAQKRFGAESKEAVAAFGAYRNAQQSFIDDYVARTVGASGIAGKAGSGSGMPALPNSDFVLDQ